MQRVERAGTRLDDAEQFVLVRQLEARRLRRVEALERVRLHPPRRLPLAELEGVDAPLVAAHLEESEDFHRAPLGGREV